MKRVLALFLACFLSFSAPAQVGGPIIGQGGCTNNCTFTGNTVITGGTITGTNAPYLYTRSAIPVFIAGTGSMGNNGALTLTTALGTTYANCYVMLPAGSIAAGVPSATDVYYATGSSTTALTVFNNKLSANLDSLGNPTIPASPTAFATTGPGAYTGVTGNQTLLTLTLTAGTMGATGQMNMGIKLSGTNNGDAKTVGVSFGGTSVLSKNMASSSLAKAVIEVTNRAAAVQDTYGALFTVSAVSLNTPPYSAVNTASDVSVLIQINNSTAADNVGIEDYQIYVTK